MDSWVAMCDTTLETLGETDDNCALYSAFTKIFVNKFIIEVCLMSSSWWFFYSPVYYRRVLCLPKESFSGVNVKQ